MFFILSHEKRKIFANGHIISDINTDTIKITVSILLLFLVVLLRHRYCLDFHHWHHLFVFSLLETYSFQPHFIELDIFFPCTSVVIVPSISQRPINKKTKSEELTTISFNFFPVSSFAGRWYCYCRHFAQCFDTNQYCLIHKLINRSAFTECCIENAPHFRFVLRMNLFIFGGAVVCGSTAFNIININSFFPAPSHYWSVDARLKNIS